LKRDTEVAKKKDKTSHDIATGALERIDEDRKRLISLYDKIETATEKLFCEDSIGAVEIVSESLVKIADSLTKQTAQIIELAKIKQKEELEIHVDDDNDGELTDEDRDSVYGIIDAHVTSSDDDVETHN